MKAWRVVASKQLIRDKWMKLQAHTCEMPGGGVVSPYYVMEESDWVHVVARNNEGELLVVQQYRHGAQVVCAEFPGGVIDDGEHALEAARRELLEETGYIAGHWQKVGQFFANPARQTNTVHVYFASDLTHQAAQQLDDSEEIDVAFADDAQVKAMIANGLFSQGMHIASFYMALEASSSAHP